MATNRQEILNLLTQGKITAEEAADLLSQPQQAQPPQAAFAEDVEERPAGGEEEKTVENSPPDSDPAPTWFRVRVRNSTTGQNKVSVNIPVGMLKFGLRIGRQFTAELEDLNWKEIDSLLHDMRKGMLVEVQDEESGEHVQVFLE